MVHNKLQLFVTYFTVPQKETIFHDLKILMEVQMCEYAVQSSVPGNLNNQAVPMLRERFLSNPRGKQWYPVGPPN